MITVSAIVDWVRVIINEANIQEDSFSEETDSSIGVFINHALTLLASNPLFRGIITTTSQESGISMHERPDGCYCAYIDVPQDFVRLISVRLSEWVRPVYEFLDTRNPQYDAQWLMAPGIGAGPQSPMAFLLQNALTKTIEAHAVKSPSCTYELDYIAKPKQEDGNIDLPEIYTEPLSYITAGLYLQSVGEVEASKTAFSTAQAFLQREYNGEQPNG